MVDNRVTNALRSLLQEATNLRRLPIEQRQNRVYEIAKTVDQKATQLYESVLAVIFQLFLQAVLETPENTQSYQHFLILKEDLIQLIPVDDRPEPIKLGVYERIGEIILGEEYQESTF